MSLHDEIANVRPPSRLATWLGLRAPLDWASLLIGAPQLARAPRGDGRPVLLIPGYRADESSMRPLRRYLEFLNYDVYDWGRGRNVGDVDAYIDHVGERAQEIFSDVGDRAVTIARIDLDEIEKKVHERNSQGIKQPVTAIYSKSDGIVGWRACIDNYNAHAPNIEVNCSHFGLGANGRVWRIIADVLAPEVSKAPANA